MEYRSLKKRGMPCQESYWPTSLSAQDLLHYYLFTLKISFPEKIHLKRTKLALVTEIIFQWQGETKRCWFAVSHEGCVPLFGFDWHTLLKCEKKDSPSTVSKSVPCFVRHPQRRTIPLPKTYNMLLKHKICNEKNVSGTHVHNNPY